MRNSALRSRMDSASCCCRTASSRSRRSRRSVSSCASSRLMSSSPISECLPSRSLKPIIRDNQCVTEKVRRGPFNRELCRPGDPSITERYKELRRRLGWSQQQLADQLGVSVSFVGHVEIGDRRPSDKGYQRLCELEVAVDV